MYTDTTNPNHMAREAIDNSVDEAMEGYATSVQVILHKDGSLEIIDDGRGMPTDMHPEEKMTGVELILTKLHSGAKFSKKQYRYSGGLHGVGISVVNALSKKMIVTIKRDNKIHQIEFKDGDKVSKLKVIGKTKNKRENGTSIRFWPNTKYFDSGKFAINKLKHTLRAKAVLCSGLYVSFHDEAKNETKEWHYENGLPNYLTETLGKSEFTPEEPFVGSFSGNTEAVDWAVVWITEGGDIVSESY